MNIKKNTEAFSRRKFVKWLIGATVLVELGYVLYSLVGKKSYQEKRSTNFNAGSFAQFEKDTIYPFGSGGFYLSCFPDGGFLAISTKCTHLGCSVQSNDQIKGFSCPCHASQFNKYGEVLSPPATRALDIFPITIVRGEIMVDLSKPIKRQKFESQQLTYI